MTDAAARLRRFLETEMAMSHIYQPVMIRTILEGGGAATKRQIAAAILATDLSQLEYYEQVVSRYPGPVLQRRGIVEYNKGIFRLAGDYRWLDEWERAELKAICEQCVANFIAKRQDKIWAHRTANADPVPGTLRWQVISRALGRCEACGISCAERALEVDHIVPRSKGGSNELWNLQALCSLCNVQKLDREAVDFRAAHAAADCRHAGCRVCEASPFEDMQNTLALVVHDPAGPIVSPRRHGVAYLDLWQSEVNAMRDLKRLLQGMYPRHTEMRSFMLAASEHDAGHLLVMLSAADTTHS